MAGVAETIELMSLERLDYELRAMIAEEGGDSEQASKIREEWIEKDGAFASARLRLRMLAGYHKA